MSVETYLSKLALGYQNTPGGEPSKLPSSVLKDALAELPPNSSWTEIDGVYWPAAENAIDVVMQLADQSQLIVRDVRVIYPRFNPNGPVYYDPRTLQVLELDGWRVTHWANVLVELPEPIIFTGT